MTALGPVGLADVWFGLLGLLLVFYVLLDGFDLGVGVIALFAGDQRRSQMMATLGGVWDANETWLVVFGGALFGAFPSVYGVVLHGLYIPITLMLFGLILRGVALEFREHAEHKRPWNRAFGVASLLAATMQGLALGALLGGIPVQGQAFVGSVWHWLSPFALLTAVGVVFGYTLLGATYLIIKTEGELQQQARRVARLSGWLTVGAGIGVSLMTPLRFDYVAERWLDWPQLLWLAPLPLSAGVGFVMLLRSLRARREHMPFVWSVVIFLAAFMGLAASLYPFLVPPSITLQQAAASDKTLWFMLAGIGLLIPVMVVYNAYQYRVFRGKVSRD